MLLLRVRVPSAVRHVRLLPRLQLVPHVLRRLLPLNEHPAMRHARKVHPRHLPNRRLLHVQSTRLHAARPAVLLQLLLLDVPKRQRRLLLQLTKLG